jgi:dihydrodipicolinate synthase/N-acetylneuraminate lyase
MLLPCRDPRDAAGLERGARDIAGATGTPLIIYVKEESDFGADRDAGLDAIGRLVRDRICMAIKYAIVWPDPNNDPYLKGLLARVDRKFVISGMGERPAVQHMRDWQLTGFTTGSGCIAPASCQAIFEAARRGAWGEAETMRARFMPLEDLRDAWGPARVLHHATELAGIAPAGPIPPYVSSLEIPQLEQLAPVARELRERDA